MYVLTRFPMQRLNICIEKGNLAISQHFECRAECFRHALVANRTTVRVHGAVFSKPSRASHLRSTFGKMVFRAWCVLRPMINNSSRTCSKKCMVAERDVLQSLLDLITREELA